MTATQSLRIFELLNAQFSQPDKARELTEAIEAVIDEKVTEGNKKYEALLSKDLEIFRVEINSKLTELKSEFESKFTGIEGRLRTEMRDQKVDTIKWLVGLFITLALMIVGLYLRKA